MALKRPPFTRTHEETKRDVITIELNQEKRAEVERWKAILEQSKDATIIWQMALIGSKYMDTDLAKQILGTIFNNKRRNKRLGIIEYDPLS